MSAVRENVEASALGTRPSQRAATPFRCARCDGAVHLPLRSCSTSSPRPTSPRKVVMIQHHRQRLALAVDRVLGNHQTVIQSLGHHAQKAKVVSGATILGDGRVALIVDLAGVVDSFESNAAAAGAEPTRLGPAAPPHGVAGYQRACFRASPAMRSSGNTAWRAAERWPRGACRRPRSVASSWAMVRAPASRISSRPRGAVVAHAGHDHADGVGARRSGRPNGRARRPRAGGG